MTTDATIQIIQKMLAQLSQTSQNSLATTNSALSQFNSIVGNAASYAQILGTAEGPLAQAAAASTLGQIAAAQIAGTISAGAAAEASALVTFAATGIGAGIVLIVSFILGALAASDQSGSAETQLLQQLGNDIQSIENTVLASYWGGKLSEIMNIWDNPSGSLGIDLDNLANEGTGGTEVGTDVGHFHDHALAFVNLFIPTKTPGAETFWERPVVQDQVFETEVYWIPNPGGAGSGECGTAWDTTGSIPQPPYPVPQPGPPLGGSDQQMVLDPRSMLPYLCMGISSYLTIESLLNLIGPNQPTFSTFLAQFRSDLQGYADFLSSQSSLAVNGIVKRVIPTSDLIQNFVYRYNGLDFFECGHSWNGLYGVVDSYPQYGAYPLSPPVPIPSMSPSHIIDEINTDSIFEFASVTNGQTNMEQDVTINWVMPWVQDQLILKMMARWKAIYLLNGYDKVWSLIEQLSVLANQSPPAPVKLQDNTIASGNWSARELCTILNVDGDILDGVQGGDQGLMVEGAVAGYSLFKLAAALYNIANGDWGGAPQANWRPNGPPPRRPLGIRDQLAKAAV